MYIRFLIIFYNHSPTPDIYTLSLHDALPICLARREAMQDRDLVELGRADERVGVGGSGGLEDRKSTRLNSSHVEISYAVFCLKKKKIVRYLPNSNTT